MQGRDRLYVKYIAEQLDLDGTYVPRTYIEQIQLEKAVNDVMVCCFIPNFYTMCLIMLPDTLWLIRIHISHTSGPLCYWVEDMYGVCIYSYGLDVVKSSGIAR